MNKKTIKIGSRGSKLALWQANQVKQAIEEVYPNFLVEIKIIKTKGDKILDVSLSKIGDKGVFTKEIETALIANDIDLAVHSLKDLPTELPEGLIIGGILPRGEVRDVLLSKDGKKLSELTNKDRVATSSLRRRAQILHYNPDIEVIDIRGNVGSRIKKMQDGYCDALIMAGAGIIRLGYENLVTEFLDPETILPAVGQGAVAIEIREDDENIHHIINAISDENTWLTTMAERWLLRTLEGGCQIPVGCHTKIDNTEIQITGLVADINGKKVIKKATSCLAEEASEKAIELAQSILDDGGREILDQIRKSE